MKKIGAFVAKEIREALPATILFLFLFHMISLTMAVSLADFNIDALRATSATLGALIVAKATLIIEALPISRLFSTTRAINILWKTLLFGAAVLLIRFIEEVLHLSAKHDGLVAAAKALFHGISWPLFWVLTLWILGGLILYTVVSELVRAVGPEKVKNILLGSGDN